MSVSVSMPQLGESVTEGTVTRWLKKEGERVEVDEPLLEVSTDKVDTEIPSPASGILRSITVDEDETVAVGAQLAVIEDSETNDSAPAQTSPLARAPAPPPTTPGTPPPPPRPAARPGRPPGRRGATRPGGPGGEEGGDRRPPEHPGALQPRPDRARQNDAQASPYGGQRRENPH